MNRYSRIIRNIALPGLIALMLVAAGCSASDNAENKEAATSDAPSSHAVRVETLVLQPRHFEDIVELTGVVEADDDAILSAQTAGTVVGLVERGQNVRAGQVVAQLDPSIARASVKQAEASVSAAQAQYDLALDNLKRQQPLYKDSVISAVEFENVRAQYNQAQAQLSQAGAVLAQTHQQLQNTSVTTPFSGVVEDRLIEKGEQVMPGKEILRVVNTSTVKVTAGVPDRYAGDIVEGTPVQIDFTASGAGIRNGKVTFVGAAIDPQTRTFPIEVALDNRNGQLKPQMIARVHVARARLDSALVVPSTALIHDPTGNSVFVAARDGDTVHARRQEVSVGSDYNGHAVIEAGL
ncbi:MAG TPA: efflux RND transporter periplasmic adaptor subunit, partial [Rhodothermales bacterium]|nr:efflux RND transporter periplasmic adaptor subunit [Rhodothermales bacterium]